MVEITKHDPGMLCWADLSTTDADGAKLFYGKLFGWDFNDAPMPEGGVYSMAMVRGKSVAALSKMSPEMSKAMPPHWNSYICVEDVDKTAAKVVPAGGKLVEAPFDVMDAGRMAVLQDPSGAFLCLWQARRNPGAGRAMEPNTLCWAELMTRNTRACMDFYGKVLGWKAKTEDMGGGFVYTVFSVGEKQAVGMLEMPKELDAPSHWNVYFAVSDAEATLATVAKLGGKVVMPLHQLAGVGKFAPLQDPQGAYFHVLQPQM